MPLPIVPAAPALSRNLTVLCATIAFALYLPAMMAGDPTGPLAAFGGLLAIFTPVPLALAFLLGGYLTGSVAALAVTLLIALVTGDPSGSLFFLVDTGLVGFFIAFGLGAGLSYPALLSCAAGIPLGLHLSAIALSAGSWPAALARLTAELAHATAMMRSSVAGYTFASLPLERFLDYATLLLPGLTVIGAFIAAILCLRLTIRFSGRRLPRFPLFSAWRIPEGFVWVFIALGFALVADFRLGAGLGINVMLVMGFYYLAQGLAIAVHLAAKRNIGPLARLFFTLAVLLQPLFLALFLVLGLIDFRFDFRARIDAPPAQPRPGTPIS